MSEIDVNNSKVNSNQNIQPLNNAQNSQTEEQNSIFPIDKNSANGILEEFNQGRIGDCGLIATLASFKNSVCGSELIKQAISQTQNGYSVYFKGNGKAYEITFEELEKAKQGGYSRGETDEEPADEDALLFELAFEKVCSEEPSGVMKFKHIVNSIFSFLGLSEDKYADKKSIESESPYYFMELLTGKNARMITNFLGDFKSANLILNKLKDKDFVACISFDMDESGHVWSIKSIDDEYVTLINPWDTDKEEKVKREELSKAQRIEYVIFD